MRRVLEVHRGDARLRLDRLLVARLPDAARLSRTRLAAWIREGRVEVDGVPATRAAQRLRPGQAIALDLPEPAAARTLAEARPLAVLYEDDALLAIDKPAGLVMHPTRRLSVRHADERAARASGALRRRRPRPSRPPARSRHVGDRAGRQVAGGPRDAGAGDGAARRPQGLPRRRLRHAARAARSHRPAHPPRSGDAADDDEPPRRPPGVHRDRSSGKLLRSMLRACSEHRSEHGASGAVVSAVSVDHRAAAPDPRAPGRRRAADRR